ncbi:MAG: dienelactone hydrolase family protein [Pyrinomonadaceae bacterium]|nr:dienelactone hydrolase family protein [Phycisphaerales bacterium]
MRSVFFSLAASLALSSGAIADVKEKTIEYQHGGTTFVGLLAWDDAKATEANPQPGVLVCPEWWGNNDYAHSRARQLAALGYVAIAIDMYGKDASGSAKTTTDPKQASDWSSATMKDPAVMRARAQAGMKALTDQKIVDAKRVAAIGYCMGGTVATELARTGADLKGVVTFHASKVSASDAADNKKIKAMILVCHGNEDTFVPPGELATFAAQMKEAGIDYEIDAYANAVHAFTNKNADSYKVPGVKYNQRADHRSWERMKSLFVELFGGVKEAGSDAGKPTENPKAPADIQK